MVFKLNNKQLYKIKKSPYFEAITKYTKYCGNCGDNFDMAKSGHSHFPFCDKCRKKIIKDVFGTDERGGIDGTDRIQLAKYNAAIRKLADNIMGLRNSIETLKLQQEKQNQVIDYLHEKILQIERDNFRAWTENEAEGIND